MKVFDAYKQIIHNHAYKIPTDEKILQMVEDAIKEYDELKEREEKIRAIIKEVGFHECGPSLSAIKDIFEPKVEKPKKPREHRCEVCRAKRWVKISEFEFRCDNCGTVITMVKLR